MTEGIFELLEEIGEAVDRRDCKASFEEQAKSNKELEDLYLELRLLLLLPTKL